jgi:hypothetical protein
MRFRASAKHECFSSESFNLPYDLRRQFGLQRIYVNPRVINSYVWAHYVWFKYITRHWAVKWRMGMGSIWRSWFWVTRHGCGSGMVRNVIRYIRYFPVIQREF